MNSSHPQYLEKDNGLESFWTNRLLQKVKSSHTLKHQSLREETIKLHKTLMMHGINMSVTWYKIYEVIDIANIAHNIESRGNDQTLAKSKEVDKEIKE